MRKGSELYNSLILRQVVNTWADVASLDIPERYRDVLVSDLLWQWPVTMKFAIDAMQNMADHADDPEGFNQNEGDAWREGIDAAIRMLKKTAAA